MSLVLSQLVIIFSENAWLYRPLWVRWESVAVKRYNPLRESRQRRVLRRPQSERGRVAVKRTNYRSAAMSTRHPHGVPCQWTSQSAWQIRSSALASRASGLNDGACAHAARGRCPPLVSIATSIAAAAAAAYITDVFGQWIDALADSDPQIVCNRKTKIWWLMAIRWCIRW